MLFHSRTWAWERWLTLPDTVRDSTSLMMSKTLYFLDDDAFSRDCSRTSLLSSYFSISKNDGMLWHFRRGHSYFQYMKYLFPQLFSKVDVSSLSCDVSIRAKQPRVSFPSQPYKPIQSYTLIHSNVWGPTRVTTASGKRWFVTFINDHTCLIWVFLLTDKSKVSSIFQWCYTTIETQFNAKVATL